MNEGLVDGQYRIPALTPDDMTAAHQVRLAYRDLRLDLADAVGVVLADRFKTDLIFTLDERDFRAVKPLSKKFSYFRILPADPSE